MDALFEHDAGRGALHFRIPVQAEATDNVCRSLPVRGGGTAVAVVVRAEGCPELVDIGDLAVFSAPCRYPVRLGRTRHCCRYRVGHPPARTRDARG
ncbi:hypothetical protein CBM2634_P30004 [Cupriavidus taiwanensis]|uniref:Uncharacterized protein n=1 Tax=Cupriavidus taiwanensis TaxID=164546 RepID=A0A375JDS3_9BURK|nr:hypothetical protein CBM2634_P30004 [Cupriavidus taiwanensis]